MRFHLLVGPNETEPFVARVNAIADQHKEELGFLPHAAYEELALKGQLWIAKALDSDTIVGYVAFGGSNAALKVSQLYIDRDARGRGIGSDLLARLKEYARTNHRQIVTARVASDLPANRFWEKQGFYVIRQVPGGKTSGRTINIRVCDLPKASLLEAVEISPIADWLHGPTSEPLLRIPTYSLDLNVVFDVLQQRIDADLVARLFSTSFGGEVKLCVSSEFMAELKRGAKAPDADPLLKLAAALPVLPQVGASVINQLATELRAIVFPKRQSTGRHAENDASDLRHLATCIRHRVRGFVTRDRAIIGAAPALRDRFNLEVLSPFELISPQSSYTGPVVGSLGRSDSGELRSMLCRDSAVAEVGQLFADLEIGDAALANALEPGSTLYPRTRLLVYAGDALIGFASWDKPALLQSPVHSIVIVREERGESPIVIDHFLSSVLQTLPEGRMARCELWTSKAQLITRETARRIGFSRPLPSTLNLQGLSKWSYHGIVGPEQWDVFAQEFLAAVGVPLPSKCPTFAEAMSTGLLLGKHGQIAKKGVEIFEFESELSPLLAIAPGRPALIVPIRDKQASQLLPTICLQNPLFSKEAMSRIERAYFGAGAISSLCERGAIVIFYVSGAEGGRGEAVGAARITASGSGTPAQLQRDLIRQGVLSIDELEQMARKGGEIGYFTFDSFIKFSHPVPFSELKRIGCVGPANLVTSQSLPFEKLIMVLALGR